MFCSKCGYSSFDHLAQCPKCGYDWAAERRLFNVEWGQAPGDPWMSAGQAGRNEETEVSGEGYQEGSRMQGTTRSSEEEENTHASDLSPEEHRKNEEAEEEASEFSLDLGSELEPDNREEHVRPRAGRTSSLDDEIEFPDLDISSPDDNKK